MDETSRHLVRVVVERSLLDIGPGTFEIVQNTLKEEYSCDIEDCLHHPEYLKEVLRDLYGNCYNAIFGNIQKKFENLTMEPDLDNFIKVLREK